MAERIDPELLQARWVLNGIRSEDLPDLAARALEQGFDGTSLRQLAGLVRPTLADLEHLPEKAFADMGLRRIDRDQAVTVLIERELPLTNTTISTLVEKFPDFMPRWKEHLARWGGEPAGVYNDMSQFAHFVVEDLYDKGTREKLDSVFEALESLLDSADTETDNLIAVGFFERLYNLAYSRPGANSAFEELMRPRSLQLWRNLRRFAR
jgi:hypothetical protein